MRLHGPEIWHWTAAELDVQREGQGGEYSHRWHPRQERGLESKGRISRRVSEGFRPHVTSPAHPSPPDPIPLLREAQLSFGGC